MRALNRENLAKTIDPNWTVTEILQRLMAHYDDETDVFEGEEINLEMARKLLKRVELNQ